jgi:hypothetical protein
MVISGFTTLAARWNRYGGLTAVSAKAIARLRTIIRFVCDGGWFRDLAGTTRLARPTIKNLCSCFLICIAALAAGNRAVIASEKYPNGFPTDPSFFPIGVWLQSPAKALEYKAIGINTFVDLWNGPTEKDLADLAKYGMYLVGTQNDIALSSPNRAVVKGWLHDDEPDNRQPIGFGLYGNCIPAPELERRTREMKARDPTRPVMINFGQGIANKYWRGLGPCTNLSNYYSIATRDVDILSFDIYPVASRTPQVKGKLEYVARGVTRLKKLAVDGQKVWAILETTALDPPHRVMPAQLRAEVWMAIIHGASGIVYFVHEFASAARADAIFRYPDIVGEVARQNRLIGSMAAVLNSPNVDGVTVQSDVPIATLVKRDHDSVYVFAVAMENRASQPRFNLRGVDGSRATVLDEGRSIPIAQSAFQDSFEGYGVHIYRIPLHGVDER